jgi:hypothetical protein
LDFYFKNTDILAFLKYISNFSNKTYNCSKIFSVFSLIFFDKILILFIILDLLNKKVFPKIFELKSPKAKSPSRSKDFFLFESNRISLKDSESLKEKSKKSPI